MRAVAGWMSAGAGCDRVFSMKNQPSQKGWVGDEKMMGQAATEKPKTIGRPRKSKNARRPRTICIDPELWAKVERQRQAAETPNDALDRLLRTCLA